MLDPKAVAEVMDYIVDLLMSVDLSTFDPGKDGKRDEMKVIRSYTAFGQAVGAAQAIHMLCKAEDRPKMRGASGE